MNAWPTFRLDECCEIVSGATPSTAVAAYWDGDINWATPKDLSDLDGALISETPRKITQAGLEACAATLLPPGSVLFSSRAPIGHVAINTKPMATNQGFKSFVPHQERMHSGYLYHWLRYNRAYLESLGNGATFKEVSKSIVARVELPVPPVGEQRRIAAILDEADALRAKRRAALAQLDEMAQAIFVEMFGGPRAGTLHELQTVCELVTDGTHYTPTYSEEGVIFLSAKNVTTGRIDWINIKRIPDSLHTELQRRVSPKKEDILLAKNGTTGVAALVDRDVVFDIYVSLALLRPGTDLDPEFLLAAVNSPLCRRQFDGALKGIGVKNLHLEDIRRAKIPVPSRARQKQFVGLKGLLQAQRLKIEAAAQHADSLFASLQHRAFRGEL